MGSPRTTRSSQQFVLVHIDASGGGFPLAAPAPPAFGDFLALTPAWLRRSVMLQSAPVARWLLAAALGA